MQALEHAEQFAGVGHVKAGTVVANKICLHPIFLLYTELYTGELFFAGELPCVREQIGEQYTHELDIARSDQPRLDDEFHLAFRLYHAQFLGDARGQGAQVHRRVLHGRARDAREIQHVVDQLGHALAGGAHAAQIIPALIIQFFSVIFKQGQAESVNRTQRRTQVV